MSNTEKGILLYNEWIEAMRDITPKEFKRLILAIYECQILDVPQPEFNGIAKSVASVIFPYVKKRKKQAERGKLGYEARLLRGDFSSLAERETKSKAPVSASSSALSEKSATASSYKIKENNIAYHSIASNSVKEAAESSPIAPLPSVSGSDVYAHAEKERDCGFEEQEGEACGYGVYRNVYLSVEEYLTIARTIPKAAEYIDMFSMKLRYKGYRYPSHFKAIIEWWERDKNLAVNRDTAESSEPENGSFDTDSFFEAAVRRSLGEE